VGERGPASIRPRVEADVPGLVEGLRLVAESDGYPSRWPEDPAAFVRAHGVLGAWVAERGGHVVGQALLRRPDDHTPVRMWTELTGADPAECAVLSRLFVAPAGRGAGAGAMLVRAAVDQAARLGLHTVLDVVTTDAAAVRLYERLGWVRFAAYEEHFGGDGPPERLVCFAAPPDNRIRARHPRGGQSPS
jgi:GNAT superfamily N-acetyltransferase